MSKILHKNILENCKFKDNYCLYYKYIPKAVVENENFIIYYDRTIYTQHTVENNRSDITILDKNSKKCLLVDVAVRANINLHKTFLEKRRKYAELAVELK